MPRRRLALLAAACLALGGVAALLVWRAQRLPALRPLEGLRPVDIARIELGFDGRELALARAGAGWRLVRPSTGTADAVECDGLAGALLGLTLGLPVSGAPASYEPYELNESSAARVRVFVAGEASPRLDGYLGKEALGFDALYFRFYRERPVYIASGVSGYLVRRDPAEFAAKPTAGVRH